MKLLVCGSRDWDEPGLLSNVLDAIHMLEGQITVVINGCARGADAMAQEWARVSGLACLLYTADWDRYGRLAGPLRNQKMLDEGKPDLVVAFVNKPLNESKGTKHMVGIARAAGVKTIVVEVR